MEPEVKRWTAKRKAELVKDIIKGKTTAKEAPRTYDLTPAEVERWVDDALGGMERCNLLMKQLTSSLFGALFAVQQKDKHRQPSQMT